MKYSCKTKATKKRQAMKANAPSPAVNEMDVETFCNKVMRHMRPITNDDAPIGSSLANLARNGRLASEAWLASAGNITAMTVKDTTAIGTLIQKAHLHPAWVEMTPPSMGPVTVQTPRQTVRPGTGKMMIHVPINNAPVASRKVRAFRSDDTPMILIAPLMIPAAPVPDTTRPAMKADDVLAVAQMIEPTEFGQTIKTQHGDHKVTFHLPRRIVRLPKKIHLILQSE